MRVVLNNQLLQNVTLRNLYVVYVLFPPKPLHVSCCIPLTSASHLKRFQICSTHNLTTHCRLRPRPLFPIRYRADTCATILVLYTHRVVKGKWSNWWVAIYFSFAVPRFTLLIIYMWKRRKNDIAFYVIAKIRNIIHQVHTCVPLSCCIPSSYCYCKWNKLLLLIFL